MSVKIMGMVFDLYPVGGGEMLLALSLADFADDDGGRVFPSVPTLARKTRQSERNVQYQLRRMEQAGFISVVERNAGGRFKGKKYKSNEYRINVGFFAKGEKIAPLTKGCKTNELTVQSEVCKGATVVAPNSPLESSLEPPLKNLNTNRVVEEIDELVEAALWAARTGGGKIYKEAGFRYKVRTRILSCGPSSEDVQTLLAWRTVRGVEVKNETASKVKPRLDIDQAASEKGALLYLSENNRARIYK